jgi:hypothetical protein
VRSVLKAIQVSFRTMIYHITIKLFEQAMIWAGSWEKVVISGNFVFSNFLKEY